jgi:hypothetical protein
MTLTTEHETTVRFLTIKSVWSATCSCGWVGLCLAARDASESDAHRHTAELAD